MTKDEELEELRAEKTVSCELVRHKSGKKPWSRDAPSWHHLRHVEHRDVVLNPKLIIEVLSPSTELFDRSQKFWRYRTHTETLTDYVVVSQRMPLIEHYHRQSSGEWVLSSVSDIEGSLPPPSIGCTLKLTDVYDRVSFPAEPEEAEEPKIKLAERPS